MLVLSRKIGEKIRLGSNIVITFLEMNHNKIRLGIEAPDNVKVFREEIVQDRGEEHLGLTPIGPLPIREVKHANEVSQTEKVSANRGSEN